MKSIFRMSLLVLPVALLLTGCPRVPALGGVPGVLRFGVTGVTETGEYETVKQFQIFNDGHKDTALVFALAASEGWITVSPTEGTSTGPDDPVTVTVTIDRGYEDAKLIPSFATGLVNVTSNGGDKAVVITTAPDYYTQEFDGDFDLQNTSLTFTPNGSLSFYGATQEDNGGVFPTDPVGGLILDFDDFGDPVWVTPLGGKKIPFYEGLFSSLYISSQGYVGIGNPGTPPGSAAAHFAQPQITLFPIDATEGGDVSILQDAEKFVITYQDVPTAGSAKQVPFPNDVQLELFFNGDIRISYLDVDPAASGPVGLSAGAGVDGGVPESYLETDLSEINTPGAKVAL